MEIFHRIPRPTPLPQKPAVFLTRKGDDSGVMPSLHSGVKGGEAKRGGMASLHWQCQGLCSPASVLCVCGLPGLAQLIPP